MAVKVGVLPSDGKTIEIEVLPIFALEDIGPPLPGPMTYKVTASGQEFDLVYPGEEVSKNPPSKPTDNSSEFEAIEWTRWQAYLAHTAKQQSARAERLKNVRKFILANCVKPEDLPRIGTEADLKLVYQLAIVPSLTIEDLEAELDAFFRLYILWRTASGSATKDTRVGSKL